MPNLNIRKKLMPYIRNVVVHENGGGVLIIEMSDGNWCLEFTISPHNVKHITGARVCVSNGKLHIGKNSRSPVIAEIVSFEKIELVGDEDFDVALRKMSVVDG